MRAIKEIAKLTGISVRTLHYYDEIGLLCPTAKSGAGYRLYDDKALETLRQILFFREFDIPLKEIKAVLENPALDRNQILQMQRKMLVEKKGRMERLIASIDNILKGENSMDFTVFDGTEIRLMYDAIVEGMSDGQRQVFVDYYGSMEAFKENFLKNAGTAKMQKDFAKLVEWYGGKKEFMDKTRQKGMGLDVVTAYQKRLGEINKKIARKMAAETVEVNSLEVKELIGEYDFVAKQLYQMDDVSGLMLEIAKLYDENKELQAEMDAIYGEGFSKFFARAVEAFYNRKE